MHALVDWLAMPKQERRTEIKQLFAPGVVPPRDPLQLVLAPHHWGVFASVGPHFQYALFGRDSAETAEDILDTRPTVAHDIILTLACLQGTKVDYQSEEEPGKIHHEFRRKHLNGEPIPEESQHILYDLQHIWGGIGTEETIYYGSYDATPLFIRLVGQYVAAHGEDILNKTIQARDGQARTVRESVELALDWLDAKIAAHPQSLLAYKRMNAIGILNQCWKDSATSHIHTDGSLPNYNEPVASIELQGLAYDALLTGVRLGLGDGDKQRSWRERAGNLQESTLANLWLSDRRYFAQGLDIDPTGKPRRLDTITSDAAALLDSNLLHDLPSSQAKSYIEGIAALVFSDNLLTDVGVRCRAVEHWDLVDYIDYHGPNAVWPKETFDIAKGLRRAGMADKAEELETRIRHGLIMASEFIEFFYVSRDGKIWYDRDDALAHFGRESHGHPIATPEPGQAWTIAAALRIARSKNSGRK